VEIKSLRSIIIGFSGKIGSGKTTLSAAVAEALNWPRVSFGDYVRGVARQRGLDDSRKVLQEIGASLVENPNEFCLSVLHQVAWKPGQHLVVDGVRHARIVDALRRVTEPSTVFLVFVKVHEKVRRQRRLNQGGTGKQRDPEYESHATEEDVKAVLPAMADLVVDGTRRVPDLMEQIVAWMQDRSEQTRRKNMKGSNPFLTHILFL